jgi:hypothetical protein
MPGGSSVTASKHVCLCLRNLRTEPSNWKLSEVSRIYQQTCITLGHNNMPCGGVETAAVRTLVDSNVDIINMV